MSEMMQVPDGWEVKPLKDILTIQYGKDQKEVESESGKYPILGSGGVIGYTNNFLYDKPSVLIGRKGTINNPQYMETPFWTVDTLFYSHIKNKNVPKWVFYVFQSINWDSYNEASGVPSLSTANINRIEVLRPTVKEQEQIAKILSTLDKGIEATNRLIEKEKNIKKALMQELLTNGIDKDGHIRTRATHTYKESELGLIPDEWEVKKIENIADIFGGGTPDRSNNDFWENGTIFWATPTDITAIDNSNYIEDTKEKISEKGLSGSSAKLLPIGSILLTSRATIGERKISKIPICTNQGFTSLVPKGDNGIFIYYLLDKYIAYMYSRAYGTTFPEISRTQVKNMPIALPKDENEQKQIAKILTTQDKKIETEETNLAKLKELKKGLMSDLLSGKVRVKV